MNDYTTTCPNCGEVELYAAKVTRTTRSIYVEWETCWKCDEQWNQTFEPDA